MKPYKLFLVPVMLFALSAKMQAQPIYRLTTAIVEKADQSQLKPVDSLRFYYSGNNGGAPTLQWLETAIRDGVAYINNLCYINEDMKFDSVCYYNNNVLKNVFYHTIDGNGDIVAQTRKAVLGSTGIFKSIANDSVTRTYAAGKLQLQTKGKDEKRQWFYNAQGRVDSIQVTKGQLSQNPQWTGTQKFQYNSNNDWDTLTNTIDPLIDYAFLYGVYTYAMPGKPSTVLYIEHVPFPAGNDTVLLHQYTYNTANLPQVINTSFRDHNTGDMLPDQKHEYTWNANAQKTSETQSRWDDQQLTWKYTTRYTYTYNSFDLPATAAMEEWDDAANAWAPSMRISLQYGLDWPLKVDEPTTAKPAIHLYPNPALNVLTINAIFDKAAPFTATILDMQGRVWKQWNGMATKNYNQSVPVTDLATGTYILQIGNSKTQFSVISR